MQAVQEYTIQSLLFDGRVIFVPGCDHHMEQQLLLEEQIGNNGILLVEDPIEVRVVNHDECPLEAREQG